MPANTGNIGRTCCATGTRLHLIEPMGFRINDKMLKRAGLYVRKTGTSMATPIVSGAIALFLEKNPKARDKMYMATTKARHRYTDVSYEEDAYIMFGKESAGIPEEILVQTPDTAIRIPMNPQIRSLNLSNSVAIVLYEALRQNDFFSMQTEGNLHRLSWENPDIV